MSELEERIAVLRDCGFVDETEADGLRAVARLLVSECGITPDNEALGVLITHLAASLKRVRDGEVVAPLSTDIIDDVRASGVYEDARRLSSGVISALGQALPQGEFDFVLVHIGGLLSSGK